MLKFLGNAAVVLANVQLYVLMLATTLWGLWAVEEGFFKLVGVNAVLRDYLVDRYHRKQGEI